MQKDVIYIDTEDDITAIIGKVKDSPGKVVAIVPPKRIGAIQSTVNLKLVHRAAENAKKHLVIVTNNHALAALAGSAGIPVAKNLESRPEMPELNALEIDDEDIIDGNDLPVGDHVRLAGGPEAGEGADSHTPAVGAAAVSAAAKDVDVKGRVATSEGKSRPKVPNFDAFRKKLFVGIAAFIALVGLLVWAIVYAPNATIAVHAKTSDVALNSKVSVGPKNVTSLKDGTMTGELKSSTKDVSIAFTATGQKDIGEKATGSVKYSNSSTSAKTIAAGTSLTTGGGLVFTTTAAVTVPAGTVSCPTIFTCTGTAGTATGSVAAAEAGDKYNGASGTLSGAGSGISTTLTDETSGGTTKIVTVVQQSDVDAVADNVVKGTESEAAKKALQDQYGKDYVIIADSFKVDSSAVKPSPAVGQESGDGKAALAGKITYTIMAVPKTEAGKYLDAYFAQQIDGRSNQKVYSNGLDSLALTTPIADAEKFVVTITTNGSIGPKIDANEVKDYAKGKKAGEIKAYVEAINGVDSSDVSFSPFWVTKAPGDTSKIKVEFKLNG